MCPHMNFRAKVDVIRLADSGGYMADITINCEDCGIAMQFLGLPPGLDTQGATVSLDGKEARIAISPEGTIPNPLQRMAYGVRSSN